MPGDPGKTHQEVLSWRAASEREEGPTAREVYPPIPANPRPGTRTIVATTAEYGRWRLTRVGLILDDAIREELTGLR